MKLADQREIHAPREAVWAGITDPDTLKRCISGCQEMTGSVEHGFDAVVVQKVGPVKATFRGHVDVLDVVEGEAATLRGEGKGGPAGFAKGEARVVLTEIAQGTRLDYEVEAKVGGKLAQLGGRVIDGVAGRMSDGFFDRFKEVVEEPGAGASGAGAATGAGPGAAPATAGVSAAPADASIAEAAEPTAHEPAGAERGGSGPIGGGPSAAGPNGAEPEKKGWLSRLVSRDKPAQS